MVQAEAFDLLVKTLDHPAAVGLAVKSAFRKGPRGQLTVTIPARSFRPSPFVFVVVLEFVVADLAPGPYLWILGADEFARVVPQSGGFFKFRVTPPTAARSYTYDRWRYRPLELATVVETALKQLEEEGTSRPLPASREEVIAARRAMRLPRLIQ